MSIPADTAARSAAGDSLVALERPKPTTGSRLAPASATGSGNAGHADLAASPPTIQERTGNSTSSSLPQVATGLTDEPLIAAFERKIRTLQDTLKERDQVVQMLTQRLEQAADQLDRLQRTGAGRGGAVAIGVPPELIETQQTMAEQLSQLLGQWEELEAAQTLTRIESRLTALQELVAAGSLSFHHGGSQASTASASSNKTEAEVSASKALANAKASQTNVPGDVSSAWEKIKSAMLAGESGTEAIAAASAAHDAGNSNSGEAAEPLPVTTAAGKPHAVPEPLPEPPPPVDLDHADRPQLCDAIRSRDEFISLLLRRLSAPDASTEFPDWDKLNQVPEELQRELLSLRNRLQEKLRVAEVDLSLQRAKLAREEARLSLKADQIGRQMRQLGLSPDETAAPPPNPRTRDENTNTPTGRRWLQFLQRSNGSPSANDAK